MSKLQWGFEFEVLSVYDRHVLKQELAKVFPEFKVEFFNIKYDSILISSDYSVVERNDDRKEMRKRLEKNKHLLNHYVDTYSKLEIYDQIEIVFPIVSTKMAKIICSRMEQEFFKTGILRMNKTCGLHVNVSFVSKNIHRKLNLSKLAISFDIDKWKKVFDRTRNKYCSKVILKSDINSSYRSSKGDVDIFLNDLNDKIFNKADKYHAINATNFNPNSGKGRIEFRVAGGVNAMSAKRTYGLMEDIELAMHESININTNKKIVRRVNKMLAA